MTNIYALYKGEDYIGDGTIPELAKLSGLKKETVEFYRSPISQKRKKDKSKGYHVVLLEKNIKNKKSML